MWQRLFRALFPNDSTAVAQAENPEGFYVYRVRLPEGIKDVMSLAPDAFEAGLRPEAIIGVFTEPVERGAGLAVANFRPNTVFVELLHDVVATQAPTLPDLQAEARRQGSGRVYVIDARTPTPEDQVPPEDIIGGFEVKDGAVVPGSYQAGPKHQIFSSRGLFKLEPTLHARLMERLTKSRP